MTSAAKLFDNRRYRFDRNPGQLIDSSDPFSPHNRRHNYRRQRHDLPRGCNPNLRLTNQLGRSSLPERESHRLDQGSRSGAGQALSGNVNVENLNRILGDRFSGNDRLPGAVLLARERLLERLGGVSLLGHRRISRVSTSTPNNLHDNLRDSEDLGPPAVVSSSTSSYSLIDPYIRLHESRNRPPGLNQDALDCLHVEVFTNTEICYDGAMSRASEECSICLESFLDGIELICLPCKHRFHSSCLNPWVRTCGDCPYCRTGIIV